MTLRQCTRLFRLLPFLCGCTAPADHQPAPIEHWTLEPLFTIGGADSGPASFTWIKSLDADRDGRILALEQESQRIEVFDSTGRHLRSIGRKGEGPGEFTNANGFRIAPDGAIWVNNPRNNRIATFNADGSLRRELPLRIRSYTINEWEAWFEGDTPVQRWDVFSAGGRPIAEATSPVEFHARGPLSVRGDTFYGITMDSNDVVQLIKAKDPPTVATRLVACSGFK
jgi:hypothetical protein